MKTRLTDDSFTPAGTRLRLRRMGYGTMQLSGPHVWGPPRDREAAIAVLREAVERGVNHIDTAQFYGPDVANQLIREALSPYPDDLTLVTKVGFVRGADASWQIDRSAAGLERAVYENLDTLGLSTLDIVNLRLGAASEPDESPFAESLEALAGLQQRGLIRHIGLSNVTPEQFTEAKAIVDIVCVQNQYNLVSRSDDAFIDALAEEGVAYVPFFPLGGFTPLQSSLLNEIAEEASATPKQTALAWLLQRSPNILVIAGTSSVAHLRENLAAASLSLSAEQVLRLNEMVENK
ncbi:oxidoreductase [Pantoea sp. RRHST58]|uniref:oxidoreductase n=1 Tax=Pantoea sp. RRHST58 TaxID=3425183 RepID=UPI003DA02D7F